MQDRGTGTEPEPSAAESAGFPPEAELSHRNNAAVGRRDLGAEL